MSKKPKVIALTESTTGRNITFKDTETKAVMTRAAFVERIKQGAYPDYTVKLINGVPTPVSKPDGNEANNLG